MIRSRVAVALVVAASVRTAPAAELDLQRFDRAHGLSGHPVTALVEDGAQRLWVGTWGGGVFVGDGGGWRRFGTRDGLLSNRIACLIPGAAGEMWVSSAAAPGGRAGLTVVSDGGVVSILPGDVWEVSLGLVTTSGAVWFGFRDGGVSRFADGLLEPVVELDGVRLRAIVEDDDQAVWLMGRRGEDPTAPGVLYRSAAGALTAVRAGLPRAAFHALLAAPDGRIWLGTEVGLFGRSGRGFAPATAAGAALDRPIRALSVDASEALWAGLDGSVVRIAGDRAQELRLPTAIGPVPVLDLMGGARGGVFVRTPQHLLRLEGRAAEVTEIAALPPQLDASPDGALESTARLEEILDLGRTVISDHEGGVWGIAGDAIVRYLGDEGRRFRRGDGLPSDDVRTLFIDSVGRLWAGTARGLAVYEAELGRFRRISGAQAPVRAVHQDRGGIIYVATDAGVARIEQETLVPWQPAASLGRVDAFAVDAAGALWVGGEAGLFVSSIDGLIPHGAEIGLEPGRVTALLVRDRTLWVGFDNGLARRRGDRFEYVTAFSGQHVRQLLDRGDRGVWVVTADGLKTSAEGLAVGPAHGQEALHHAAAVGDTLWLSLEGGLLKVRDGSESLLDGVVAGPARSIVVDTAGSLWLATADGVVRHTPVVSAGVVSARTLGGGARSVGPVELTAGTGPIWMEVSAVSWLGPRGSADLRYEARLRPRDSAWGALDAARLRPLGSLPVGRYVYEVRAVNRELVRGPVTKVPISIRPASADAPWPDAEPRKPRRLKLPPLAKP